MLMRFIFATLTLSLILVIDAEKASANARQISDICERAAQQASTESGVPLTVLRAISLTETGRKKHGTFQPWPWTVNMEGAGKWFDTYGEAKSYVDANFKRGARSFDVGCFQINYRWHHKAFSSIEQMFEPRENALYAAKFLSDLYNEFGSWSKAAGAYHSRTPKYARKYAARFERIRANLGEPPLLELAVASVESVEEVAAPVVIRTNTYPLLQSGSLGRMASLVPLGETPRARIIDVSNSSAKPVN